MLGEAKNAERFSQLDADQDGRLDDDEMAPAFWRDTLGEFFGLDADRDGRLTTEDLLKFGYAERIARRTVRACDEDGDGKLSFIEFRATTFENPTSDWYVPRRDADNDCRLSWKEFYIEEPPALTAQCRYIFGRFDLNKNGFLTADEWEFQVNPELAARRAMLKLAGSPAPELTGDVWLNTAKPATWKEFRGKPALLVLFDLKQPSFLPLIGPLLAFQEMYGKDGFKVIGIHAQAAREEIEKLLAEEKITFPVVVDDGTAVERFEIGFFACLLIDGTGRVASVYKDSLAPPAEIERLLEPKGGER